MVDKEILDQIKDHPFEKLRGDCHEVKEPDEFWEMIKGETLVTNLSYNPEKLEGSGHGPDRRHIKGKTFENVSFAYTEICDLTFQDNFFVNCLFIGTTFKRLRIRRCSFLNCYMLHCLFEDTYVHVSSFDKCMDKTKYANVGVHLYQQLMRNFKAIDQPDFFTDIPHIPSKFVEIVPLSHRQGNCIPYAAIRWHDFGNRPALGRPLGHFSRHPDTPLLSLSPRRRFPRPTPERVFVADHQSSSGFSGTGPLRWSEVVPENRTAG